METSLVRLLPFSILLLLVINPTNSQNTDDLKIFLISFLRKLSPRNPQLERDLGWTTSSDPCLDSWQGITCNTRLQTVRSIVLESLKLDGSIDDNLLSLLCNSSSLSVLSLKDNALNGSLPQEIERCPKLTHIYLNNNRLSGPLPSSLPNLRNLKRLDISQNNFSGDLPWNMSRISGLLSFLCANNHLTGTIPKFDLNYFNEFDVSFNKFSGSVPLNSEKFPVSNFAGNLGLCGSPLEVECPPPQPPPPSPPSPPLSSPSKSKSLNKSIMVTGYVLFALATVLFIVYGFLKRKKNKIGPIHMEEFSKKKVSESNQKSEYSISSSTHSTAGIVASLVMLKKDGFKELKFEELLRAPAELLGKGRFGSLYKVIINGGAELAVKRIKDWTMSGEEFQKKIVTMDQASHSNVLPVTAFYCSKQEKLVVYEFQKNGSLFKLLHDNKEGRAFTWRSRLNVAAGVSAGLAYMHQSLRHDRSATATASGHGNLKSSNILFSSSMDPLISEYGLTALPTHRQDQKPDHAAAAEPFSPSTDVYAFGIILLELLTGKPSHGFNLAQWVQSVVREEWTVEVFDRCLLEEGERAEEAMLRLLHVALQCLNAQPEMTQIAALVAGMRDEEERLPERGA